MTTQNSHTKEHAPSVTIVCETYNQADFVSSALEGFYAQKTDFDVDFIIHDDASTDGTQQKIKSLVREDHRLQGSLIFQDTNFYSRGIRPHRFTFPKAQGKYIAWCEGDDYWRDPGKLEKQVQAMESRLEVDICVHPAMRLSMRTGRMKRAFYYGGAQTIIPPEVVIARHDQFAPTASVMMRTEAVKNLPEWFYHERGLPVGDFFIEAILGRKGVLYLPDVMSVYRRGVPGSYSERFSSAQGEALERSLEQMLYFVNKLESIDGIPPDALEKRRSYVRLNYALQFLAMGDLARFRAVSSRVELPYENGVGTVLRLLRAHRSSFDIGRRAFRALRYLRS